MGTKFTLLGGGERCLGARCEEGERQRAQPPARSPPGSGGQGLQHPKSNPNGLFFCQDTIPQARVAPVQAGKEILPGSGSIPCC